MKSFKTFLALLFLTFQISDSFAGSSIIGVTPGSGNNYAVITQAGGNFVGMFGLCDGTAAASCATVTAGAVSITGAVTQSGTWNITNISGTISLPTGAATAAGLTTINTTLGSPFQAGGSIGNTTFAATQATAASLNATVVGTGTFAVQAAQSGTWNITNISGTVSLPTGASTSANQTNASQKTQIVDGSGNVIAATSNALNVQCANCSGSGVSTVDAATFTAGTSVFVGVGGQFTSGGATVCVTGHQCMAGMTAARAVFSDLSSVAGTATLTGNGVTGAGSPRVTIASDNTAFSVNAIESGTWNITNISGTVSLPTGAATSANQTNASAKTQIVDGSGNVIASTSNNLNVQCANCSGSGVSAADGATFTVGTSLMAPIGGQFTTGGATACSTGNECTIAATAGRALFTNLASVNSVAVLTGTGAVGTGAQRIAVGTDTATIAGSAPGTAGSSSTNVISVQGIASGTNLPVSQATAANLNATVVGTGTFAVQSTIATATGWGIIADKGTFTASTSPSQLISGQFTTGGATACATTQACAVGMTVSRGLFTDLSTINAVTVLTGTGAVGTGSQRVAVGTDTATIAGSAPGTAGTPSANVITVQGATSMTALATNVTQVLGSAISATNGLFANVLQGNAVLSISNPSFARVVAGTTGGASTTGNIAAANTTAVVVKGSAGTLFGVQVYGIGSAPAYLKIYNATSATCGSGTPVKRIMIPAASTAANGAGSNVTFGDLGVAFGTGITYCVTTGITDADATAPAASTFLVNIDWN